MRSLVQTLRADVQKLGAEIGLGPELEAALAAKHSTDRTLLLSLIARSKRVTYVNAVISIYGLLEESIDKAIMQVAEHYEKAVPQYSDLPDCVKGNHRDLTLLVLSDGERSRTREKVRESAGVHILASTYTDSPTRLNKAVFTRSTANYRHDYIVGLLARMDIAADGVQATPPVVAALTATGLPFRDPAALIADLVIRRNEIAHAYQTAELLDVSALLGYLSVVASYIEEMVRHARDRILKILTTVHLTKIGKVAKTWRSALGIVMTGGQIEAPCWVVITKTSTYRMFKVDSIQIDGVTHEGVLEYLDEQIHVGLGAEVKRKAGLVGGTVYVIPDEWKQVCFD